MLNSANNEILTRVGRYIGEAVRGESGPRFRRLCVIVDTFSVPSLLATPL
jgi:hypothetical protein